MDLSAAITSGAVLAVFTAVLGWIVNGRFNRIETELRELRSEILQVALAIRHDH